jgi:hypothetical protein
MTLARNISAVEFSVEERTEHVTAGSFSEDRHLRIITMILTSAPEGRPNITEERQYKICLRPTDPLTGVWSAQ